MKIIKNNILYFNNKQIRSLVIKKYLDKIGLKKVVCFSCGNATRELKNLGLDVLDISPNGLLSSNKWFNSNDVLKYFPERFNATSGYLPIDLMIKIGKAFKNELGNIPNNLKIPSGSGETIICLSLAYPNLNFIPLYDNNNLATKFDKECPLNPLIDKMFKKKIIIKNKNEK